ncbi:MULTISPECIES: hypothetical protein [Arthrobacter]|uniref:Uncharacterized protein n=1 Tax=Arthrobacter terricola TaxID=2547396 RepID=A0A4R5KCF9_9MICC|nr:MULTISPECIES: hypothetical protein [Arthrobacter]MBT8162581.1 hypothetical protein [Arthrobacter sp. GN70]TDF92863.1 hypothetical protein E1809_17025 [Arthrobacter terricola]
MTKAIPTSLLVILAIAFATLQVALGLSALAVSALPELSITAMAGYGLMMVVSLFPGPRQLPAVTAWILAAGAIIVTLLVQPGLPPIGWPGYADWHPGALQCLFIVVALRGRPIQAAAGIVVFAVLTLVWSAGTQDGIDEGVNLAILPVIFVATAIVLARFLDLNDRQARAKTRQALRLLDDAARARARSVQASTWAREVQDLAGPPLRLAATTPDDISPHDRDTMLHIEARIRDTIRGGYLATRAILEQAERARTLGISVNLLDDSGGVIPTEKIEETEECIKNILEVRRGPGKLTVRARPVGSVPSITVVFAPEDDDENSTYVGI